MPRAQGEALAAGLGMAFQEASARELDQVDAVFRGLARSLAEAPEAAGQDSDEEIVLELPRREAKKAARCC